MDIDREFGGGVKAMEEDPEMVGSCGVNDKGGEPDDR